ncbi:HD domain-containing protein [Gordonia alkanivorans]|uniref:HD domain-containing protein n=1 Tax=Gordonia alkanivorans TaxID=84096 RepID=UPI0012F51188|nr:HD domain-containing protein [Gordonia alkanivorans]
MVRDPIHKYVYLPTEISALVEDVYIQRLRRISQTSMSSTAYPSMTGTRFEHTMGTMHLAQRAWGYCWKNCDADTRRSFQSRVRDFLSDVSTGSIDARTREWLRSESSFAENFEGEVSNAVAAAALLHDVGHPPFSHALEPYYEELRTPLFNAASEFSSFMTRTALSTPRLQFHEIVGMYITSKLPRRCVQDIPWKLTLGIIMPSRDPNSAVSALKKIFSGDVDIDRLDYLQRDNHNAGTTYGSLDAERLLYSIELHVEEGEWTVGYGLRARSAVEDLLFQRNQYYRWVAFHPHAVALNTILRLALETHDTIVRAPRTALTEIKESSQTQGVADRDAGPSRFSNLDYFSGSYGGRSDRSHLAHVDDSSVYEQLRRGLSDISDWDRAGGPPIYEQRRFAALATAALDRVNNWLPIWKDEMAYEDAWKSISAGLATGLMELQERAEELRSSAGLSDTARRRLEYEIEAITVIRGDFIPAVQAMNKIAKHLMYEPRRQAVCAKERHLAKVMDGYTTFEGDLAGCFWVIAYNPARVSTAGEGVKIFRGEDSVPLETISPMVRSLVEIEDSRPHFHAFVMSTSVTSLPNYGTKLLKETAAKLFEGAYAISVVELWSSKIEKIARGA